ncbi:5'/3'-nucleotidase SurE [Leptolyngbyaceae cyanobacterium UHCC 1019]
MVFVITNDDGIDAPGIRSLLAAVRQMNLAAIVVAPQSQFSGCGHQVTTTQPILVEQRSEYEYAIAGTPVDCVRIALSHLCPQAEGVLSGINAGGNLGTDVYISGTVAAVREAAMHRIPGIALSNYRQGKCEIDWAIATSLAIQVLEKVLSKPVEPGTYWNVNLPQYSAQSLEPKLIFCAPCTQPLPNTFQVEDNYFYYKGDYSNRAYDVGGDVEICFSGHIAVTQLSL